MGLQSCKNPNFGDFGDFGTPRTKWHLGASPVAKHREYYKGGRWWLPPSAGCDESCESVFARGSSVHQKCSSYALINLLFGLCRSVWVIDSLVTLPNPYLGALAHLLPPKCYKSGNVPQLFILPLFSHLNSQLNLLRSLGVHHLCSLVN
jgi:hypothetical protein